MPTRTISETIADWLQATGEASLSPEIIDIARWNILDVIGVTLAGSREPVAQIVRKYLAQVEAGQQSSVIGLDTKTSCVEAAFANGVFGHCLDFDDILMATPGGGGGHITATVFPAALAAAEMAHKSGKELVLAYVLGCEVAYRIGRAIEPGHYLTGWHATSTEGIFGAVAAASKLLGLSAGETANALGIAASDASGLRENFGTMTKPFHVGQAAAKGLKAMLLARLGFDSSRTIFEGKTGFCNVLARGANLKEITGNIGQPFCLPQTRLKLYPCCGASHTAIQVALELKKTHSIVAEEIENVEVRCQPLVAEILTHEKPKSALEGKFSMQFPVALALSEGSVTLPQFTDEKVNDPGIVALMERVKLTTDPQMQAASATARPSAVTVTLKNGRKLTARRDYPPGSPESPIARSDLAEKYRSCARLVLSEKAAEESFKAIKSLDGLDNVSTLLDLLCPSSPY